MKKIVINADDLGKSEFHNNAVLEGYKNGILKCASIMPNMPFYKDALYRVVLANLGLSVGVHLNLIEGKALNQNLKTLCDKNGNFKNSFLTLLLKSKNKKFLKEAEIEFRSQIEKVLENFKPTHIDSHIHIHAIPALFDIACKLAKEYKIPRIRTQAETMYCVNNKKPKMINRVKIHLLNHFTKINKERIKYYRLNTNSAIIGVGWTGMMTKDAIIEGIKALSYKTKTLEVIIHPCLYYEKTNDSHEKEFEIITDKTLEETLLKLGFENSDYMY